MGVVVSILIRSVATGPRPGGNRTGSRQVRIYSFPA